MQPTRAIIQATAELLAADPATFSAPTALKVHLVTDAFSPGLDTDFGTLTEATFTGYGALDVEIGDQQVYYDPLLGQWILKLMEPAGGWTWEATAATSPTQVITGYVVTNTAGSETYGSALLPANVPISGIGDGVNVPDITLTLAVDPWA